jgi:DNA-binding NtrC family response regulator
MAARRILLVDDERDIRDGLMTFLGTLGWDVRTADGTAAALSALEAGFEPEALIVDFRLRDGESGLEVLDAVRASGCVAPAWLITGDTSPARIAEARVANIPVIYKPIDGVELVAAVDAFLDDRSRSPL